MASTKLVFLAIAVLLQTACWCVVSQQDAVMTWTRFDQDGGSGPAACDGQYHFDGAPIAALSTEWFGSRCFKGIHITSKDTGKTVRATVVDQVDGDNMIATTGYVWELLGFENNQDWGEVAVTWSDE